VAYTTLPAVITSIGSPTRIPSTTKINIPNTGVTDIPASGSLPSDGLGFFIGTTTADDFLLLGDTGFFLVS